MRREYGRGQRGRRHGRGTGARCYPGAGLALAGAGRSRGANEGGVFMRIGGQWLQWLGGQWLQWRGGQPPRPPPTRPPLLLPPMRRAQPPRARAAPSRRRSECTVGTRVGATVGRGGGGLQRRCRAPGVRPRPRGARRRGRTTTRSRRAPPRRRRWSHSIRCLGSPSGLRPTRRACRRQEAGREGCARARRGRRRVQLVREEGRDVSS